MHNLDVFLLSCIATVCIAMPPTYAPRAARILVRGCGVLFVFAAIAAVKAS